MSQSTNLNVNPYNDDFDVSKNYYKVLFKPGVTVQSRELTTLQSILQDQIEKFGSNFYSSGGVVIPGNFSYDGAFTCVEVEDTYRGIYVEDYFNELVGKLVKGKNSNITAKIEFVLSKENSIRNSTTIYVKYQGSSTQDFSKEIFEDGEELVLVDDVIFDNVALLAGEGVFKIAAPSGRSASSVGSAAKLTTGVYFIRGYFVNVYDDVIILDQYSSLPSYRVGLEITESIVNSNQDPSLNDNSKGFTNYSAPGADRLKIVANLTKKSLDDFNDDNFIELFNVKNGIVKIVKKNDVNNFIKDILAERTYDESGNYSVTPFVVEALESLNDRTGNGGLFLENQNTFEGATPNKDLAALNISPAKSYIKGYEVNTSTEILDYIKPREEKSVEGSSAVFSAGNILRINNINGIPNIGLTNNTPLILYDRRLDGTSISGAATSIGQARIYDIESFNTAYSDESSQFNLYLFDIQTYTKLTTNINDSNILVGNFVVGKNSGASGYVIEKNSSEVMLYQVSGKFSFNEQINVSGISSTTSISSIIDYSIDDIKSVGITGTFVADTVLSKTTSFNGPFDITVVGSAATVSAPTPFANTIRTNDIISYFRSGTSDPVYNRVSSISGDKKSITVSVASTVSGVSDGGLGSTTVLQSINLVRPEIANYNNSSLYSKLSHSSISDVSFLNSNIFVKRKTDGITISSNSVSLPSLQNTSYVYAPFDDERYNLINSDDTHIDLTGATLTLSNGGKDATLSGFTASNTSTAKLISTLVKTNVSSKYKKLVRSNNLTISRTKYSVPKNAGLTFSSIYGTRVEDNEISLNVPDIYKLHAVFQSSGNGNPQLPSLGLTGIDSANLVLGEVLVGKTSGAVAIYIAAVTTNSISFVYKSKNNFVNGETVEFKESGYSATITSITIGDPNVVDDFILDNGQREQYYDFGRIIKKDKSKELSSRITIIYDNFEFESTDSGDIITANSYSADVYGMDIPTLSGVRNTDMVDVRPRVSNYSLSSTYSPFEFLSRDFSESYNNSAQVISSNESVIFDYSFYLGRIDKISLDLEGNFTVIYGQSNEFPKEPKVDVELLDVATIIASPYVYNIEKDITITLTDNRRYTMSDLRDIEKRVDNLEYYTSLSLLEISTQNLLIEDSDGLNRFKSGFFVDNFASYLSADTNNPNFSSTISNGQLTPIEILDKIDLNINTYAGIKITGSTASLDYTEEKYITQPFASTYTSVNPFNIVTWNGILSLNPEIDSWSTFTAEALNLRPGFMLSSTAVSRMRSRNIQFVGNRLKPNTRFDLVFDSRNFTDNSLGTTYAFPKLIEVKNVTGSFSIGETVRGFDNNGNSISFRICSPDHKFGPIDAPTRKYSVNPYNPATGISTIYGVQSTVLNIDVESLQINNESQFSGTITTGMILYGQTSNATAEVSGLRLISDDNGSVIGSIFIPETSEISFPTGTVTVDLESYQTSFGVPEEYTSSASAPFTSTGSLVTAVPIPPPPARDPIAQSFLVEEQDGIIISSIDVYFKAKDGSVPITLEIRSMSSGYPQDGSGIIDNLSVTLNPDEVNISEDASIPTRFTFDKLVRLEGGREYAIVLISDSSDYFAWVSRIGSEDISTANLPEIDKIFINKQPSLGTLFKSQNGGTWTAIQEEDLKFDINRAKFVSSGSIELVNSNISINSLDNKLPSNPIYCISDQEESYNSGRYILVTHPNHGMYSDGQKVSISGVFPDSLPRKLITKYEITSTSNIELDSTSGFEVFESSAVSVTNPGYILISDEVISYTGVSGNFLTGVQRSKFGSPALTHLQNSRVYKYELNGISLSRINTTHSIEDPSIDSYYIELTAGESIKFASTKISGGDLCYASKNIIFSSIQGNNKIISNFNSTSINSSIRTISARSSSGTETVFLDNGYESIDINSENIFTTLRMVASSQNESVFLSNSEFVDNKSLFLQLSLSSATDTLSPIIDLDNLFLTSRSYRINSPISNYITDFRVNSNTEDPNKFVYVSQKINLSQTASSLKVLLSAYRPQDSDIRVLYKLFRNDVPDEDQVWELFPGYENLDSDGQIISESNNNGNPDSFVRTSNEDEFLEYSFTIDGLPAFNAFAVKIIGSSSNQANYPIIRDLRGIALK